MTKTKFAPEQKIQIVLDLHFGGLLGKPSITDGYAYGIIPIRQRVGRTCCASPRNMP